MVETNVDDVSPQVLGYLLERALELGALDCFFTHVQMKKNRPGVLVSILCRPSDGEAMHGLLFAETPTLGVRSYAVGRRALEREAVTVETEFGTIAVKVARRGGRSTSTRSSRASASSSKAWARTRSARGCRGLRAAWPRCTRS